MDPRRSLAEQLRQYTRFSGRCPPGEYWTFMLIYGISGLLSLAVMGFPTGVFIPLALTLPAASATVRRAHDAGRGTALPICAMAALAAGGGTLKHFSQFPDLASLTVLAGLLTVGGVAALAAVATEESDPNPNRWGPPVARGRTEKGLRTCGECGRGLLPDGRCPSCDGPPTGWPK